MTEFIKSSEISYTCAICCDDFEENNILKFCNDKHTFCKTCFYSYLQTNLDKNINISLFMNTKCPCCRTNITINPSSVDGKHIIYYNNNKNIMKKITLNNCKLEGLYETFYEDGNIHIVCNFKNNLKHGLYEEYFQNGQKKYERTYIHGKLNDVSYEWSESGLLKSEIHYKHNLTHGSHKIWYPNGALKMDLYFINGVQEGIQTSYNDNGSIQYCCEYSNGYLLSNEYIENIENI